MISFEGNGKVAMADEKTGGMRQVFEAIHTSRGWGDGESLSGPGSTYARAATFLSDLVALLRSLSVGTMLDAPCGDFHWAEPVADTVDHYVGVDVVPALIDRCSQRAGPRRSFVVGDISCEALPQVDLILCRDALVHFSFVDIFATIENFRATGAQYLLTTTFVGDRANEDVATGGWRPLNLEREPFLFPEPIATVDERCHHSGGVYSDKRLALWRLAEVPRIVV